MIRIRTYYLGAVAILTFGMGVASGQSTFASILGTVRDPSGGVVSGCSVTIENTGTSARRAAITDQSGSYAIPNLEPGIYTVKMSATGFQVATFSKIELLARQKMHSGTQALHPPLRSKKR